jgi:hypothetical protein
VLALRAPRHEKAFFEIYDKGLREIGDAPAALMAALEYWLTPPDHTDPRADLEPWREPMIEAAAEGALRLPKDAWEAFGPALARRIGVPGSRPRDEWVTLQDRIALALRSLRQKVADRFFSIRGLVAGLSGRVPK